MNAIHTWLNACAGHLSTTSLFYRISNPYKNFNEPSDKTNKTKGDFVNKINQYVIYLARIESIFLQQRVLEKSGRREFLIKQFSPFVELIRRLSYSSQ